MNSFWGSLFEHLKGCGRNAAIFMVTLGAFVVLLLLAAAVEKSNLVPALLQVLTGVALFAALWMALLIRRAFIRGRQRLKFPQLSSDELTKARSKLLKNRASL